MNIILIHASAEKLMFSDGTIVTTHHDQDCCENVYADFKSLRYELGNEVPNLNVEIVKNSGFRIGGLFVPCYNEQNGYYSDNLDLLITNHGKTVKIDLRELGAIYDDIN